MQTEHQARWITKDRIVALRKAGRLGRTVVLDSVNGFLIVEPAGSDLGDGPVLSHAEAEYEVSPVWCSGPRSKLAQARRLLGLNTEMTSSNPALVVS